MHSSSGRIPPEHSVPRSKNYGECLIKPPSISPSDRGLKKENQSACQGGTQYKISNFQLLIVLQLHYRPASDKPKPRLNEAKWFLQEHPLENWLANIQWRLAEPLQDSVRRWNEHSLHFAAVMQWSRRRRWHCARGTGRATYRPCTVNIQRRLTAGSAAQLACFYSPTKSSVSVWLLYCHGSVRTQPLYWAFCLSRILQQHITSRKRCSWLVLRPHAQLSPNSIYQSHPSSSFHISGHQGFYLPRRVDSLL